MRAVAREIGAGDSAVTITFEGTSLQARLGESVAAALTAHGIRDFRAGQHGNPRGLFCGMGVCQECLVEIGGRPNRRACMTKISGPVAIRRQGFPAAVPQPSLPGSHGVKRVPLDPDVLVIGGGAGGLTAAAVAAEAGARVVLIDERPAPGGQFFKQPVSGLKPAFDDAQFSNGRALIVRARNAGVTMIEGMAFAAYVPLRIEVQAGETPLTFTPRQLIVATGAYERGLPIPGWTLPGIMTTGAAQTLLRSYGVLAGRRILICGNGPLNLQVALELHRAGADIAAVAELSPRPGAKNIASLIRMAASAPSLLVQGMRYVGALKSLGIPLYHECALAEVEDGLLARLAFPSGRDLSIEADTICMGYGFMPSNELLRLLACRHRYDPLKGHLITERDSDMRTTVPAVFGVGDCCGLGGAMAAQEEGTIAGIAAAEAAGLVADATLQARRSAARGKLLRHRQFQAALWQVFQAPEMAGPQHDTIVCRCENVSLADMRSVLDRGSDMIGSLKRQTRLGMGRCQGRYCGAVAADLISRSTGKPLDEFDFPAPRPPIKPVPIGTIVMADRTPGRE